MRTLSYIWIFLTLLPCYCHSPAKAHLPYRTSTFPKQRSMALYCFSEYRSAYCSLSQQKEWELLDPELILALSQNNGQEGKAVWLALLLCQCFAYPKADKFAVKWSSLLYSKCAMSSTAATALPLLNVCFKCEVLFQDREEIMRSGRRKHGFILKAENFL